MTARALSTAIALALSLGCEAVPDPTFAVDDAAVDVMNDGGNTCPEQVPSYATTCCGPIACSGPTCVAACNDCTSRCTLAEICCPNTQAHATCHASNACP